jgi:hypothetical protein
VADKMGNTFKNPTLKSPLGVGKQNKGEKGPDVNNIPLASPSDPLGFIPDGGKKGK